MMTEAEKRLIGAVEELTKAVRELREDDDLFTEGAGLNEMETRFRKACATHDDCRGCRMYEICSACPEGENIMGMVADGTRAEMARVMMNVMDGLRVQG